MTALDDTRLDDTHVVHGTCHHDCPDSCGWHVTVRDGVAVQLRGNPEHPYSAGELCPKVNRFLDRVYSPERLTTPLRRVGAKGDGQFEPITWDVALAEIAARFGAVIAEHGPGAILPFLSAGNQGTLAMAFGERFWNRLGAISTSGALCGAVAGAGTVSTNGTGKALDPSEMRHSKLIILWGTNTRLTNRHLWPVIEAARADGARVVVIDPIRTITADSADWFLQPLPGTDVALMLAMMHVLIRDGLTDDEWVDEHTVGFDQLAAHVKDWTPDRAADICGLDAADIETLATMYGTIRPAAIRTLIGAEHHEHGAMFFRALTCLPALVGAWNDRGGGYARSIGAWSTALIDNVALTQPSLANGVRRSLPMVRLAEQLTETTPGQSIHALFVSGSNPMVVVPNAELVRQGLQRDDLFTVVHEQFLTDTARYADIVLPATTQIESVDTVHSWGHLYLGWNEPAITPVGESLSNSALYRRLAAAMDYTEPELFEDDITVLRAAHPDVDVDLLRKEGFVRAPYPDDGRPFGDGVFPTASGRVELFSDGLAASGQPGLPTFVAARESAAGDAELAARFPFALLTPKQHTRFINSSYSHLPKHGPLEGAPYVELVAADAERLGLLDGDVARVWNDRGSLQLTVKVTDRLRPGVVAIPWGWWNSQHSDGRGANALTNDSLTDWGGGVAYSDTLVAISADVPADVSADVPAG
jgi:anaerobic selenocysteine-containing dehydrogenase